VSIHSFEAAYTPLDKSMIHVVIEIRALIQPKHCPDRKNVMKFSRAEP